MHAVRQRWSTDFWVTAVAVGLVLQLGTECFRVRAPDGCHTRIRRRESKPGNTQGRTKCAVKDASMRTTTARNMLYSARKAGPTQKQRTPYRPSLSKATQKSDRYEVDQAEGTAGCDTLQLVLMRTTVLCYSERKLARRGGGLSGFWCCCSCCFGT